jgi:hypothetical protein
LEAVGAEYFALRSSAMKRYGIGLTTIYNWFHDPGCDYPDIPKLRRIQDAMDQAVLRKYGWADIRPECEFVPEFEEDEGDDDNYGRTKNKKYRYRWPDEIRDEVLARLLELNRQRAMEEGQTVVVVAPKKKTVKKKEAEAPLFEE